MVSGASESVRLRFGVFEVDLKSGEVRKNGLLVKLAPQPFKVLVLLAGRSGEVVTRQELQQEVWGDDTFVDFEHGLNFCIKQIREVLGDDADHPHYIGTVPRRGYRFLAPVERLGSAAPRVGARWLPVAAVVAILAGALAAYLAWRQDWLQGIFPKKRVALLVLPYENLSGNPAEEYFSDGLTDETISQLGRLRPGGLVVLSRTTSMHYKASRLSAGEIGHETRATHLLEGSVRRESDRVRITAQLILVSDQTQLWSQDYDFRTSDLLVVQREIALAVSEEIQGRLAPQDQFRPEEARAVNPDAHLAYLKGRYHLHQFTEASANQALQSFNQAVAVDPGYSPAWAGLASAYYALSNLWLPPREAMPKARASALRALELDETSPEAHATLGLIRAQYDWDWPGAEKEYQRALQLNPSNAETRQWYGICLLAQGKLAEAEKELKEAQELDPLSPSMAATAAWASYYARRYQETIEKTEQILKTHPDFAPAHLIMGWAYEQRGEFPKAIAKFEASIRFDDSPGMVAQLGHGYGVAGERRKALEILQALKEQQAQQHHVSPQWMALVHLGLGENEQTIQWLQKGYEERAEEMILIGVDPRFDSLRSDPRFQELLRRMGLR